jgi:hypothetical protein
MSDITDSSRLLSRPIWVPPKEGTRLAGIGLTKFYELMNTGAIESRKVGNRRLASVTSIENLGEHVLPKEVEAQARGPRTRGRRSEASV